MLKRGHPLPDLGDAPSHSPMTCRRCRLRTGRADQRTIDRDISRPRGLATDCAAQWFGSGPSKPARGVRLPGDAPSSAPASAGRLSRRVVAEGKTRQSVTRKPYSRPRQWARRSRATTEWLAWRGRRTSSRGSSMDQTTRQQDQEFARGPPTGR